MLSVSDLRSIRAAYAARDRASLGDALARLGAPEPEAVARAAAARMTSPDRNIRVLALRILRHQRGDTAMRGALAGLNDETRRVRAVAIQACPNFLHYPDIVDSLEAMAEDETLKRKLRRRALSMLCGDEGRWRGDLTEPVAASLERMQRDESLRHTIVFGLARLDLEPRVEALLRSCAGESEMARRALDGERIIHIDAYSLDETPHRRIRETCPLAHGRMFYWIPRDRIPARRLP